MCEIGPSAGPGPPGPAHETGDSGATARGVHATACGLSLQILAPHELCLVVASQEDLADQLDHPIDELSSALDELREREGLRHRGGRPA